LSGIYIHIPFCKQACHYCNFHFATSLTYKNEMIAALLKEAEIQKLYFGEEIPETVYFGGGTPSLLPVEDISRLTHFIRKNFSVSPRAEITLEANPDDITEEKLAGWKEAGINRLSIGVQSFFEEDLQWMNRAHTAGQALTNLALALQYFSNITIDLIYGTPQLTHEKWKHNVDTAIALNIPHLSCYALTVETKTPLQKMIAQGRSDDINPDKQSEQFLLLMSWLEKAGYEHYEISNFAKPGWRSRHNSTYWAIEPGKPGKKYLGLGPSAHSFDGSVRRWNIPNNSMYIRSLEKGIISFEKEELTAEQRINEYIMTSLRTMEGLNLALLDEDTKHKVQGTSKKYIDNGWMVRKDNFLILTKDGKLMADGIAADLFLFV
jgi:oxygen-independent coproporphyrinogen III oxidase